MKPRQPLRKRKSSLSTYLNVRITRALARRIASQAKQEKRVTADMVRQLIERGLEP